MIIDFKITCQRLSERARFGVVGVGLRALGLATLSLACSLTRPGELSAQRRVSDAAVAPSAPLLEHVVRTTAGAAETARLPLIVAVHGFGDRPEDFVRLFDALPFPARVIALRGVAPHPSGWSWFRPGGGPLSDSAFRTSAQRIAQSVDALARRHPTCGRPALTGFSQGGMLTFAVAAAGSTPLSVAVPIAGRLPASALVDRGRERTTVVALHGGADVRIPFVDGLRAVDALRARGFSATIRRFDGVGHAVPEPVRAALYDALGAALRGACSR